MYARRGEQERVERSFRIAARVFAEHNLVFNHAVVQLEHAEWLVAHGRADDAQVHVHARARDVRGARRGAMARAGRPGAAGGARRRPGLTRQPVSAVLLGARRLHVLGGQAHDPGIPRETRDLLVGKLPDAVDRRGHRGVEYLHVRVAERALHPDPGWRLARKEIGCRNDRRHELAHDVDLDRLALGQI